MCPSLAVSIFEAAQPLPYISTSGEKRGEDGKETSQEVTVLPVTHHLHQPLSPQALSTIPLLTVLSTSPIPILVPCPLTASA